jgi:Fur family ferric uptake transcriptional regulator/Fur family zinc uptake transcriptional regulator
MSPDQLLRAAGLRRTPARLAALAALSAAGRPLRHADLRAAPGLAGVDDITVYRTLSTLEEKGLLHRILGLDGAWRYGRNDPEARGCPGNHAHFLCEACGQMACLPDQPLPRVEVPPGATVRVRSLVAVGRCAGCGA